MQTRISGVFVAAGVLFVAVASPTDVRADSDLDATLAPLTAVDLTSDETLAGELAELVDDVSLAAFQEEPAADEDKKDGKWRSDVTVGLAATFGNSDNQSVTVLFNTERETEHDRTHFDVLWFWAATDGDETDNRITAFLRQDWFLPDSRWGFFAQGRYDYDSFQSWDQRLGGHGGVTYLWIDNERYTNSLRAGLGASKEWGSKDQDLEPEGLLGMDVIWAISKKQDFNFSTTIFPSFGDIGEYRWVTVVGWSLLMDEETNLSLSAGLVNEYDSDVDEGSDNNDLRIFAGLQLGF